MRSLRDYLLSLAAVVVAYCLYAWLAVPLIEPAARERVTPPKLPPPPPRVNPFVHLFEPDNWEAKSPKVIETTQGTLLFLDYQPLPDGRLEIRPCTLIVFSTETEDQKQMEQSARPIILRASEGAVLQFDEEVDLSRAKVGRLVGGRILGDVRVFAPESAPQAGDGLEIETRNLSIERTKAWTTSDVRFRYGASFGSGRDLILNLSPAESTTGPGKKSVAFGKLESMQLTHVEEIQLQSQEKSVLPENSSAPDSKTQPPVRITCDGPMRFHVERRMATFDDNVTVMRLVENAKPDRLRCKQLAVFMAKKAPGEKPKEAKKSPANPLSSGGAIERIVAVGEPVVLEAPSQNAHTEASRLEYNVQTKQMLLQSSKSGAKVFLRRGGDEFVAPELHYEVVEGQQLGKLWAPGPGRLTSRMVSKDVPRTFTAQWQKELRIRPQDGNQVISLLEGARIDVENQGSFAAHEIYFWVIESQAPRNTTAGNPMTGPIIPDRLLATGKVHADSPQLSADVDRLEAWFTQVPIDSGPPRVDSPPPPQELILQPAVGASEPPKTVREPIVRIQEPTPGIAAVTTESDPTPQHFHATGELVQMQISQQGKTSTVQELSVQGEKVKVIETTTQPGQEPFWLLGNRIDLEGGTGPSAFITVTGEPAIVSARGMAIQSTNLKLSRRDNRLLVEQAGEMKLPIQQDFNGQALADARELRIAWSGTLLFDGSIAKFRRGIDVKGPDFWAKSDEMQAMLSSRLDFSRPSTGGQKPELKRLALIGSVDLEHTAYNEEGRQSSVARMKLRTLEIDRLTGELSGSGPGVVRTVRLGGGPQLGLAPTGPVEPASDSLSFLRVAFSRGLGGNLLKHEISFFEKVEATHGPVEHWDAEINPRRREDLGQRGIVLRTDKLTVNEFVARGAKRGPVELKAEGQTTVEGRDFDAKAAKLTYATAKSQLILEGDGRQDAVVTDRVRNGETQAGRILVWTDTNTIQVDDAKTLTIGGVGPVGSNPNAKPPSPRDTPRR